MSLSIDGQRHTVYINYNGDCKTFMLTGLQTVMATTHRARLAFGLDASFDHAYQLRRTPPGEPYELLDSSLMLYESSVCAGDQLTLVPREQQVSHYDRTE